MSFIISTFFSNILFSIVKVAVSTWDFNKLEKNQ